MDFPGFKKTRKGNFFMYPIILEKYWYSLKGSEQKVLDYILRQTYGFNKTSDKISLSQFAKGNGKNTLGAGISQAQAATSLKSLEKKGFIKIIRRPHRINEIRLRLDESSEEKNQCSEEMKALIALFEPVAGYHIQEFMENAKEFEALEKVVKYYGVGLVRQCIESLAESNAELYMPTITSPRALEKKMSNLLAAIAVMQREHGTFSHIDIPSTRPSYVVLGNTDFSKWTNR